MSTSRSLSFYFKGLLTKIRNRENLASILVLVFWGFGSRFLGVIRTILLGGQISQLDAELFNASTGLNDFLNSTFIIGSVTASLIPQVIKLSQQEKENLDLKQKQLLRYKANQKTVLEFGAQVTNNTQKIDLKCTEIPFKTESTKTNFLFSQTQQLSASLDNKQTTTDAIDTIDPQNLCSKKVSSLFLPNKEVLEQNKLKQTNQENLNYLDPQTKVNIYLSWCVLLLGLAISAVSLLGIIVMPNLLQFLNYNLFNSFAAQGKLQEYITLNRLMLLAPIFFALKTIFRVFLNSKKSYQIISLEGVITNLGILIGLTIFYRFWRIYGVALGLILGFALSTFVFAWQAVYLGFRWHLGQFLGLRETLIQTLQFYIPRVFLINYMRVTENLITLVAKTTDGQISSLRLALDIQPVFFTIISAVSVVFLPNLTEILAKQGKSSIFWKHLGKYLRLTSLFALLASFVTILGTPFFLWFLRLVSFAKADSLLQNSQSLQSVWLFTLICSLGLTFEAIAEILNAYFTATQNNFTPIIASLTGNLAGIILAFGLRDLLGPGLAVSISFVTNVFLLCLILSVTTYQEYLASKSASKS